MKYSNYIGIFFAIALIVSCFFPWVYIGSINTTITGLQAPHTNFGRPGVLHIIWAVVAIFLFIRQRIWTKRTNVITSTLNFAWSIRNYLIITQCEMGDCPEKKAGIYIIVMLSLLMLVMALLPKLDVEIFNNSDI